MTTNLKAVKTQIQKVAKSCQRSPDDITLVAVSKMHGEAEIEQVLRAGHRVFGENRVQEAQSKWTALKEKYPDIELHLIGPLQTNKVRDAVALFDVIESVDRSKLAKALSKEMAATGRHLPCFIQVNTGEEPQKAGVLPADVDEFIHLCRHDLALDVAGLMCIPPVDEEPALHFALLRKMAERNGVKGLSMGMSGDFDAGIQLGATHIRVGTAIFGNRAT